METFGFDEALKLLETGKYVSRLGWNGKGMYLWLLPGSFIDIKWVKDPVLKEICEKNGGSIYCEPAIRLLTAQKTVSTGWKPTNIDLFAKDYIEITIEDVKADLNSLQYEEKQKRQVTAIQFKNIPVRIEEITKLLTEETVTLDEDSNTLSIATPLDVYDLEEGDYLVLNENEEIIEALTEKQFLEKYQKIK